MNVRHRRPQAVGASVAARIAAVSLVALISAGNAAPALAYDPKAAAAYADKWSGSDSNGNDKYNYPAYPKLGSDCTNFVSQALKAGGYPTQAGGESSYHAWYENTTGTPLGNLYDYSFTWAGAENLLNNLYVYSPGGSPMAYWSPGSQVASHPKSLGSVGDVIFYDWGAGEGVSHAAIQVGYGMDFYGWTGDLVDAHTASRWHVFWSLRDVNPDLGSTTWVTVEHVAATN